MKKNFEFDISMIQLEVYKNVQKAWIPDKVMLSYGLAIHIIEMLKKLTFLLLQYRICYFYYQPFQSHSKKN